jgi:uncharacterized protein (DUF1330 family)
MTLVAILTVRNEALDAFREYERTAAMVMARHGGAIERAVVIPSKSGEATFREIHIVTFPDEAAFEAYRRDEEMARIAHLREESVLATEIMIGEDGPDYRRG